MHAPCTRQIGCACTCTIRHACWQQQICQFLLSLYVRKYSHYTPCPFSLSLLPNLPRLPSYHADARGEGYFLPRVSCVYLRASVRVRAWVRACRVCVCVRACVCVRVCFDVCACVCTCVFLCTCVRVCLRMRAYVCVHMCTCAHAMCLYACAYACVCMRACVRVSVRVFLSYLQYVPRNPTSTTASLPKRRGFVHVCLGLEHVSYIPYNLNIHQRLHEYLFVCMPGCMSTAPYVHVTHTQHIHTFTYTRAHIHTHHTIMNFSHDLSSTKSLSKLGKNIRITRTSHHLGVRSTILCPFALFKFVLSFCVCAHVCIRV